MWKLECITTVTTGELPPSLIFICEFVTLKNIISPRRTFRIWIPLKNRCCGTVFMSKHHSVDRDVEATEYCRQFCTGAEIRRKIWPYCIRSNVINNDNTKYMLAANSPLVMKCGGLSKFCVKSMKRSSLHNEVEKTCSCVRVQHGKPGNDEDLWLMIKELFWGKNISYYQSHQQRNCWMKMTADGKTRQPVFALRELSWNQCSVYIFR